MEKQVTDNQIVSKNFVSFVRFHFYLKRLGICSAIVCLAFWLAISVNYGGSFINVASKGFLNEMLYGELYKNFESMVFNFFIISLCAYVFPKATLIALENAKLLSTLANEYKIGISTTIKLCFIMTLVYAILLLSLTYCSYYLIYS